MKNLLDTMAALSPRKRTVIQSPSRPNLDNSLEEKMNRESGRSETDRNTIRDLITTEERRLFLRLNSQIASTPRVSRGDIGSQSPIRRNATSGGTLLFRSINQSRMEGFLRQSRPNPSFYGQTQRSNATPLVHQLNILLSNMTLEQRLEKAARHLNDALQLRTVRHDIDLTESKFLKRMYMVQTNLNWQGFLYLITWLFLMLSFFEPTHSDHNTFFDENPSFLQVCLGLEIPILVFYVMELFMEIFHKIHDPRRFRDKFLKNKVFLCKLLLDLLFLIDFIVFYSSLPTVTFRYSRPLRPFCLALYSKQLRRTFFGILKSIRQMFDILLFFSLFTILVAAIGVRIIGDLDGDQVYDEYSTNFKDFGPTVNALYILFTKDNYPDIMMPAIKSSYFYLFYFIPFVGINTLLFIPIPIAVIFDAFRAYRAELVVRERIKEREALVACFLSLDVDGNGSISKDEFMLLCGTTYGNNLDEEKVDEVFLVLDEKRQGKIALDAFFNVAELMEDTKNLSKSTLIKFKPWDLLRKKVNRIFRFDKIASHTCFEVFMNLIVLFNTIIILYYAFEDNDDILEILDRMDDVLVYIYVAEIVVKIFGLGVHNYFSDKWNIMDFVLTIISLATDIAVSFTKIARTAKAGRLLRVSRAQRAFKLIKVLRSFKLFKCCYSGLRSFNRIQRFVQNIMLCLPIVLKLTVILFMVSYFYAIIGMEIFNSAHQVRSGESPYLTDSYADFDHLGDAFLILFQVIVQAKWGDLLFDWAWRFDDLTKSSIYFNSFNTIANFIIISLLTGLIWEVFTYMEKQFEQQEKIEEQLDEIYYDQSSKKRSYKHSRRKRSGSRDMTLSQFDVESLNDSKNIPKRQVKSMNSLDVFSNQKKSDPLGYGFKFSDSLRKLDEDKNSTKKFFGQTYIPSRFKVDPLAMTSSEIFIAASDTKRKEGNDIELILNQVHDEPNKPSPSDNGEKTNIDTFGDSPPKLKKWPLPLVSSSEARNNEDSYLAESPQTQNQLDEITRAEGYNKQIKIKCCESPDRKFLSDKWKSPSIPFTKSGSEMFSAGRSSERRSSFTCIDELHLDRGTSKMYGKKVTPPFFPTLKSGDEIPVLAETEKSLEMVEQRNTWEGTEYPGMKYGQIKFANKRIKELNIEREQSMDYNNTSENFSFHVRKVSKHTQYSRNNRDDSLLYMRKYVRSGSYHGSVKAINNTIYVNETFISEGDANPAVDDSSDAGSLESEFYLRKIVVCTHVSSEKNQLEYIETYQYKDKMKQENKLLGLDTSEEESEEEKEGMTKSEDDISMSGSKTKVLERMKKKMQAKVSQTGDRILRKALLQNQDQNVIQRYEDEHFVELYGKWFEYLKNPKIESIKSIFELENKVLIRFMRLMRQKDIITRDFIEITSMIEESVNRNLIRKGSIGKFLFKDAQGKWFFLFKENQKFRVHYLSAGFWNHFDDIFKDKTKLYEGQDILFPGLGDKFSGPVDQLYNSFSKIAKKIKKSSFLDFDRKESLWNVYIVPFQASSAKKIQVEVLKDAKQNHRINFGCIDRSLITEGVFFSVNYIMNVKNSLSNQQDKRVETSQIIEMEKKKKVALYKGYQDFLKRSKAAKIVKQRTSLSVQISKPSSTTAPIQEFPKKRNIHELLKNDTKDGLSNSFAKNPQAKQEGFLPLQEYIDFLRDVRDTLNLHKDHLLSRFSSFYSELHSKNKTFS